MGKGQRERKAAAAAALTSTLSSVPPSLLQQQHQQIPVMPKRAVTAAPFFPSSASSSTTTAASTKAGASSVCSETSASSDEEKPGNYNLYRVLASEEEKQKLKAMTDMEAIVPFLSTLLDRANAMGISRSERRAAVDDVVEAVQVLGPTSDGALFIFDALHDCLSEKGASIREGALLMLNALCQCKPLVGIMEPLVVERLSLVMQRHADSENTVKEAAAQLARTILEIVNPLAAHALLTQIYTALDMRQWQSKVATLRLLKAFSDLAPAVVAKCLPEIIPSVSNCVWDTKKQVQEASVATLTAVCRKIENDDVVPLVPLLVQVIAKPEMTMQVIDALLATTFVANVDAPTLALIAPLLHKALRDTSIHSSSLKRKASAIIDSMCRLVTRPSDVLHFVPLLLPQLETAIDRLTDDEVVEAAMEARAHLVHAAGGAIDLDDDPIEIRKTLHANFLKAFAAIDRQAYPALNDFWLDYVAHVCAELAMENHGAQWRGLVMPYLTAHFDTEHAERVCDALRAAGGGLGGERVKSTDPNDVCDLDFSLAYGGKILLRNARLRLTRGHRYGLVGKNGVGKTTLMRNLAAGTIDGLPAALRTVYVQHEHVVESQGSLLESMVKAPELAHQTQAHIEHVLRDIGFTPKMLAGEIDELSGGWRMKLAIARAMLYNADVLLLDEPTNHLDVHAVAWLVQYLNTLQDVTVLLVSHDTGFLDAVCTDVLHYETKQLVLYEGSLSEFVEKHPEAKHYYELKTTDTVFKLPQPGRLEGISSTTRRILTLEHCSFTYPGTAKPQLQDVTIKLCLASRVAVIGANGAGKSTLIKLIVQETAPDTGEVWKHPNVRVAYVAQHSFHHVEQHLDASPVEYFQWRFGGEGGVDRELSTHVNLQLTDDEKKKVGQSTGQIEKLVSRTKGKRGTFVYEAKMVNMTEKHNRLFTLEQLQEMGLGRLAEAEDIRQATLAAGLDLRPLTTREIQRHLNDFNLAPEFGTHGKIRGLSGGQKVKLVVAAAMWNRPHLLVLDEPTNYLDRAALGALADGIRDFGGGVIMISHSEEFYNSLCTEKWMVENGRVRVIGEAQETEYRLGGGKKAAAEDAEPEEPKKAAGSINSEMSKPTKLTNPKTLRPLSKQEIRKLMKISKAAGKSFDEYVGNITRDSPEWKWL